jgi:hypothetical protein
MTFASKIAPALTLWVVAAALAHADSVSLRVQPNRTQIYTQEAVVLSVNVVGTDDPRNQPDLSGIKDFTVRFLGTTSRSQRNFSFMNGRMTRSVKRERLFSYELVPQRTGKLRAGPVRLKSGGRTLTDAGPVIQVTGIEEQDSVIIRVVPSKTEVLVDESFTVALSVLVKRLPGRFHDASPIDSGHPPSLSLPYLSKQPPKGLEAPDINRLFAQLEARSSNAAGFVINGRTPSRDSIFDMGMFEMFEQRRRLAKYALKRDTVTEDGQDYYRYSLTVNYTPVEEGSHTFGPVIFKGTIIGGATGDGRAVGKSIFAVGPAATVRVVPPPEEGRPETYIGAVGTNINVEASLDAQTCQVGDPLTLTLDITGTFRQANVEIPILGDRPRIARHFRVYDDTVRAKRTDNGLQCSYMLRPTTAGTIELPPIAVSYYDTADGAYKTIATRPVPVQAREGAQVDGGTIIGNATNTVVLGGESGVDGLFVIAPLNVDPAGTRAYPISPRTWHLLIALIGPAALVLAGGGRLLYRHSAALTAFRRKRTILHSVSAALRQAEHRAGSDPEAANRELCAAIRLFLSWFFGAGEGSLTPADTKRLLDAGGIERESAVQLQEILERSFNAAFTGLSDSGDVGQDCRDAARLIIAINGTGRAKGRMQ